MHLMKIGVEICDTASLLDIHLCLRKQSEGLLTDDWSDKEDFSNSGRLEIIVVLLPLSVATSSIDKPSPMMCQLFIANLKKRKIWK